MSLSGPTTGSPSAGIARMVTSARSTRAERNAGTWPSCALEKLSRERSTAFGSASDPPSSMNSWSKRPDHIIVWPSLNGRRFTSSTDTTRLTELVTRSVTTSTPGTGGAASRVMCNEAGLESRHAE